VFKDHGGAIVADQVFITPAHQRQDHPVQFPAGLRQPVFDPVSNPPCSKGRWGQ
jgi:hypothetical protein